MDAAAENPAAGNDDHTGAGAQFKPSGRFAVDRNLTVCAVLADPAGILDGSGVAAEIYYPEAVAFQQGEQDELTGCGKTLARINLWPLDQADGFSLFCDQIRNNNNNLPVWHGDELSGLSYDYSELCAAGGELNRETSFIFCGNIDLAYDDPSGDYRVAITAGGLNGASIMADSAFKYLDFTNFETDFNAVFYGAVKLNELATVNGDTDWGSSTLPTIRNTGNTRLQVWVEQNDMGLGQTAGAWNVRYRTRVGATAAFTGYYPKAITPLAGPLDLGRLAPMDFSIEVLKFPPLAADVNYDGILSLSASRESHLTCVK